MCTLKFKTQRNFVIKNRIKKQVLSVLLHDVSTLYKKQKNGIMVNMHTISFLTNHVKIFKSIINYELVLYFEKYNLKISVSKLHEIEKKRAELTIMIHKNNC